MKSLLYLFRLSRSVRFWILPFVTVSAVLVVKTPAVRADEIRVCPDYGVVRDRSDHEAPLLPRRSVAHCARSYQTLDQTYRVLPGREARRSQVQAAPQTATTAAGTTTPAAHPSQSGNR